MHKNMGTVDRLVRTFVVAPLAVVLAIVAGPGSVGFVVGLAVAAIMLGTSAIGFCPLYPIFKVSTCSRRGAAA
ncbi:MAG: DUF2892 domain-containing protein [Acidimicrobiales bacterium]|nr:DUF2892 domain-containing protein [Acidimicrobiales bacterium]